MAYPGDFPEGNISLNIYTCKEKKKRPLDFSGPIHIWGRGESNTPSSVSIPHFSLLVSLMAQITLPTSLYFNSASSSLGLDGTE